MLGKLLKYDLKWVYKVVVVFYILAFIFSIISRIFSSIENSLVFSVVAKISAGFAISMIISSLINCIMRSWARFVRNIYKDESYLTHTLPVSKKTIYLSKILSTLIGVFLTTLVTIICLIICYYSKENIELIKNMLEIAATTYDTTIISLLLIVFIVCFLEIVFIVLIGYNGLILGHKFNNNKMIKSIGIGIVLYMITQAVTLILIVLAGLINPNIMNLINTTETVSIDTIKMIMYFGIALYIVYISVYYIIGKKQLEKGIDIE